MHMAVSGRLYKREKLCSVTAIDTLFDRSGTSVASTSYPLRFVWRTNGHRKAGMQFMISVPKKRLRHAVDRVAVRRRVREAYRLNRGLLGDVAEMPVDIAFIYLSDKVLPSSQIHAAMCRALEKVRAANVSEQCAG